MAGPSRRTSNITHLALTVAKITVEKIEADQEPFLDSGSEYEPESPTKKMRNILLREKY